MSVTSLQGLIDELVDQPSQELTEHRRHLHRPCFELKPGRFKLL